MRRAEYMQKIVKGCNAPPGAMDILSKWDIEVMGQVILKGGQPVAGQVELLSTHLVIAGDDGSVLYSLPITAIQSLQRKKEVSFPKRTFAEPPTFRSFTHCETMNDNVILAIEGFPGVSVSYALELVWRHSMGQLSPRDEALLRSYHLADGIHALSLLPLDIDCNLAQQINRGEVKAVDRSVVFRVEIDFSVSIIFRPTEILDAMQLKAITMQMDQIDLLSTRNDDIRVCCEDGRVFLFNNVFEAAASCALLNKVYFASAASMVYRNLNSTKDITPFGLEEVKRLFQHYSVVDVDSDGCISPAEFLVCLGPMLNSEKGLSKALYDLFDCFNLGRIRFYEYLHGNRVLLLGDVDDRLRYLFGLFDTRRQSIINSTQFLDGMKIISMHTQLKIPRNETIESFSFRIFEQIDENHNNEVDYLEFVRALTGNFGVIDAIQATTQKKSFWESAAQDALRTRRVMSFGHPQWQQITQIMRGIQLAVSNTPDPTAAPDNASFLAKTVYSCVSGTTIDGVGKLPFGKNDDIIFSDYAPQVFHLIRSAYGIKKSDFLSSLGLDQLKSSLLFGALNSLYEMSSSGRSGSFFYISHDQRFILKSIPKGEAQLLRKLLPPYYNHQTSNPDSLITRFCALYSLSRGGQKIYFVVMTNVHMALLPVRETFDLKGSSVNRSTPMEQRGVGVALKDNDFNRKELRILHATRTALIKQLNVDSTFLSKLNLNDYSFLLGIHTSPNAIPPSDPALTPRPLYNSFQQFHGGVPTAAGNEVLYFGIIDILTDYNFKKAGEHIAKSVVHDAKQVSCVPPPEYHDRFMKYLEQLFVGV